MSALIKELVIEMAPYRGSVSVDQRIAYEG